MSPAIQGDGAEHTLIPTDLAAWTRWMEWRRPTRLAKNRLRAALSGSTPQPLHLHLLGESPRLLIAVETTAPSSLAANLAPLAHYPHDVAILAPAVIDDSLCAQLRGEPVEVRRQLITPGPEGAALLSRSLREVSAVLASGHYLPAGAAAYAWSRHSGAHMYVVQHGLVTPFAPPLPSGATLLAFSQDDARYWCAGRGDVDAQVVGSELLYGASQQRVSAADREQAEALPPLYLGQLHGIELSTAINVRTTLRAATLLDARYRPHPGEKDVRSRLLHRVMQQRGLTWDDTQGSVRDAGRSVIGVFSTGLVEAAAAGLPAWAVISGRAPAWLESFWERYQLSVLRLDELPQDPQEACAELSRVPATPVPVMLEGDPALRIAEILSSHV